MAEVEVSGLTEELNTDLLILYFESKRHSGGGPVESYTRNGSEALLTFINPADAENVLSQAEYRIQDLRVKVRRPPPWDRRKVAFCGLTPSTDETTLRLYVENKSEREAFSTVRSADKTTALVTFQEPLTDMDFKSLVQRVDARKLLGASVSLRRVRVSSDVLLENVGPQLSREILELYFENRRSGGGALRSLTLLRDGAAAIVSFEDWEVAGNVLKRSHSLKNCTLQLSAYHPEVLGPRQSPGATATTEDSSQNTDHRREHSGVPGGEGSEEQGREESKVKGREESEVKGREESGVEGREESGVKKRDESAVEGREESEVKGREESAVKGRKESALKGRKESAVKGRKESALKGREESALKGREESALKGREESEVEGRDEAEVKGREESEVEGRDESGVEERDESAVKGRNESAVKGREESEVEGRDESAVKGREGSDLHEGEETGVQGREGNVLQWREESGVQGREDSFLQPPLTFAPQCTELIQAAQESEVTVQGRPAEDYLEIEVLMKPGELRFLQEYNHELLAALDQATVLPLEGDGKTGFKVTGDAVSCRTAVELLHHIVSSITSRWVTLQYPWITRFLLGEEGQRLLRDTEAEYVCVVDTSQLSWRALDFEQDVDPWIVAQKDPTEFSSTQQPSSEELLVPPNALLPADIDNIKTLVSVLKCSENESEINTQELLGHDGPSMSELNIPLGDAIEDAEDEQLDQVYKISQNEYQEKELDEEAQLLYIIQRSMDTKNSKAEEERELQRALEMSLHIDAMEEPDKPLQRALEMSLQQDLEESDETLQRALEMSLQQNLEESDETLQRALEMSLQQDLEESDETLQRALERSLKDQQTQDICEMSFRTKRGQSGSCKEPSRIKDSVHLRVFAGDETNMVVACTALRKAITGELRTETIEGVQDPHGKLSALISALERKHGVKMTVCDGQVRVEGFSQAPTLCRQEMTDILSSMPEASLPDVLPAGTQGGIELTRIPESSNEYNNVVCSFYSTLGQMGKCIQVEEVHQVKNTLLYNQYQIKKQSMMRHNPQMPVERVLYHGTTQASATEICHHGFNRSFCGKNAALYGQGVYFAVEAALSALDKYSPPSSDGNKFVLVAEVLTGQFTVGKPHMRTPPYLPDTSMEAPQRYDSLVDCLIKPAMFVIFNDTQAYPKYLITCCKVSQGSTLRKPLVAKRI